MTAGKRNVRCEFERLNSAQDTLGNASDGQWQALAECWGELDEKAGDERVEGDGQRSQVRAELVIRSTAQTSAVGSEDRVLISGETYNIRAIRRPARTGKAILEIERGVAT